MVRGPRWRQEGAGGEDSNGKPKCVLSRWTLRFFRKDFERFYFEHHWANMSYWLWLSVLAGLIYTALTVVVGDQAISRAFDVRMDHYTRPEALQEEYEAALRQDANATSGSQSMFEAVKEIGVARHTVTIPRAGFLVWHVTWCLLFLAVLLIDRFKHRLCCLRLWLASRAWIAFGIMFVDLLITSFLNPSVARFMMFVYALLIRTCFVQTIILVLVASGAMLSAGYVGSHEFLGSMSVAEFLILNLICILASRQIEIHARLSLYRLWFIMVNTNGAKGSSRRCLTSGEDAVDSNLARNLLSLDELVLDPIIEVDESIEQGVTIPGVEEGMPGNGGSNCGTPSSYSPSVRSVGSREPSALPLPANQKRSIGGTGTRGNALAKRSWASGRGLVPTRRQQSGRDRSGSPGRSEEEKSSDSDRGSDCESFHSAIVWESCRLPPWLCLETSGVEFPHSVTGDFADLSSWAEVQDVERFNLRGPTYLDDRKKIPASPCAFSVHTARCFRTPNPLYNVAGRLPSLKSFIASHPRHQFLIYNRIVPNNGSIMNVVLVMVRCMPQGEDKPWENLWQKFLDRDDEFRNLRLKHLCSMREAPSAVTNAIWLLGGEKPVIIGKGYLDQRHYRGPNWVEVDVDISPSRMAKMVVGKVLHHGKKVIMEEMLVIEGQSPEELPERPLASWRWIKVDVPAVLGDLDESILQDTEQPGDVAV